MPGWQSLLGCFPGQVILGDSGDIQDIPGDIQDIPGDIQDIPGDIQAHLAVSQASRQAGLLSWRERFDSSYVGRR